MYLREDQKQQGFNFLKKAVKTQKMESFKTVDDYIASSGQWQNALIKLREIMLSTALAETVKWGVPVYTFAGKNIVGLAAFKSYVGIWFHQGAFLKDGKKKLINAQEGKTTALRQWRFNSIEEIDVDLIKAYVFEAIENQKLGKEITPAKTAELERKTMTDSKAAVILNENYSDVSCP